MEGVGVPINLRMTSLFLDVRIGRAIPCSREEQFAYNAPMLNQLSLFKSTTGQGHRRAKSHYKG